MPGRKLVSLKKPRSGGSGCVMTSAPPLLVKYISLFELYSCPAIFRLLYFELRLYPIQNFD